MFNFQMTFDPSDWNSMERLMDMYGDSEYPFSGGTEDGDTVLLHISKDKIIKETFQKNGWVRKNIYHRDDYLVEELYEKYA